MSVITLEGLPNTAKKPIRFVRESLYVEPISSCNLACKMCYTNVINGENRRIIDQATVLDFTRRFVDATAKQVWLYWCGTGEVFLHREFPEMVNTLLAEYPEERLTQTIQTNGTVRRLREFSSLERLDFCVSIDGSKEFHEWHRGRNTYDRTVGFCREAFDRGARSVLVRMLLTKDNIWDLDEFNAELIEKIGICMLAGKGCVWFCGFSHQLRTAESTLSSNTPAGSALTMRGLRTTPVASTSNATRTSPSMPSRIACAG